MLSHSLLHWYDLTEDDQLTLMLTDTQDEDKGTSHPGGAGEREREREREREGSGLERQFLKIHKHNINTNIFMFKQLMQDQLYYNISVSTLQSICFHLQKQHSKMTQSLYKLGR